jgi:hypothetical protein
MQKFGLALLLIMPVISHAETVHFVDASITEQKDIEGYTIGYTGVMNERFALGVGYSEASQGSQTVSATTAGVNFGVQSFDTGSVLFGMGVANVSGSSRTVSTNLYDIELDASGSSFYAEIGYAKLSGEGADYKFSLVSMDGEITVGSSVRAPILDSNCALQVGIATDGNTPTLSVGASLVF